jgi:hypothetical protein
MDEKISPLFVIQAEKELISGNPLKSIELCKRGLQFFPDFPIGYLLLAEAYEKLNDLENCNQILNEAYSKFPNNAAIKSALNRRTETGSIIVDEHFEERDFADIQNNNENSEINLIDELEDQIDNELNEEIDSELIEEIDSEISSIQSKLSDINNTISFEANEIIDDNQIRLEGDLSNEISFDTENVNIRQNSSINMNLPFQLNIDLNSLHSEDIDLIPGINFLPFKFDSYSLNDFLDTNEPRITRMLSPTFFNKKESILKDNYFENVVNTISNTPIEEEFIFEEKTYEKEDLNDEVFPTETYARILEKQRKTVQAIEIYKKLIEVKPEKTDEYIEKIKQLQNL